MASVLKVDKLDPQSGTALEIGTSGDTITVPTGAGLTVVDEVKTNKISPSSGVAFTLGDSGDTFTVPSGATITNSGTATGFGGGKIGQVLSTTKLDTFTTTSASLVDITGMTIDITPSASSSKVLVLVSLNVGKSDGNTGYPLKLLRDTTEIGSGTAAGSRQTGIADFWAGSVYAQRSYIVNYLDSPSTTSATTYKLQTKSRDGGEIAVNASSDDGDAAYVARTSSTITVMEVLA
jgi:hypothetical protein